MELGAAVKPMDVDGRYEDCRPTLDKAVANARAHENWPSETGLGLRRYQG